LKRPENIPPNLAQRLLLRFLRDDLAEEVLGDLEEKFYSTLKQHSAFRTKLNYWYQVFNYLRPFAIRKSRSYYINHCTMFQSYFKIGWRNLLKNKGYSLINIGGLAIGMAVAMLNGFWIWDELSFNQYYRNYNRIAQVANGGTDEGEKWRSTTLSYPLGTELMTHYRSNFTNIVRTSWEQESIIAAGEQKTSGRGLFTDEAAPEVFSFKMVYGTWSGLKDPQSTMISAATAQRLFGNVDPLHKIVSINKVLLKVSGVYEDFPRNTKFYGIKFFAPWGVWLSENKWIEERAVNDWSNHFIKIYVQIPHGADFQSISEKIKKAELNNLSDFKDVASRNPEVFLYPMSQWHLFPFSPGRGGDINKEPVRMLWLIGSIGMFVLFLACINFMNLSTARSERRAKEVGIRKTIGSVRRQLIYQFFSESFLVVLFSFGVSLFLVIAFLPSFNDVAAKQIQIPWTNPIFWVFSFGFIFLTSILAGSYPALFLSSFEPIKVLKGTFRLGHLASMPRKVLVVLQFSISVVLINGTVIVYRQIEFAKNRPVGYSRESLIMINKKSTDFYGKYDILRNELKNTGAVEEVSESMGPVTEVVSGNGGFDWKDKNPEKDESFVTLAVSHEHGKTVGWQFVAGRDFSRDYASDSSGLIINEAAAKYMGLQDPVGEPVNWTWWRTKEKRNYKILGVIKDMVMDSPYKKIEPTIYFIKGFNGVPDWINIRMNSKMSANVVLPKIESVFKKVIPSAPFEYKFVDEEYALKFSAEERIGKLAFIFSVLAIFISCMGLLGLASFTAEQRTKEIGIRKVVGASLLNLWKLLSTEFVVLSILSSIFATPIAYYFLNNWLQHYTYRTEISLWIFVQAGVGALLLTLATVSFQAIKAAMMNPVRSLRSE
jgi:putative ABC transport system permease protein